MSSSLPVNLTNEMLYFYSYQLSCMLPFKLFLSCNAHIPAGRPTVSQRTQQENFINHLISHPTNTCCAASACYWERECSECTSSVRKLTVSLRMQQNVAFLCELHSQFWVSFFSWESLERKKMLSNFWIGIWHAPVDLNDFLFIFVWMELVLVLKRLVTRRTRNVHWHQLFFFFIISALWSNVPSFCHIPFTRIAYKCKQTDKILSDALL